MAGIEKIGKSRAKAHTKTTFDLRLQTKFARKQRPQALFAAGRRVNGIRHRAAIGRDLGNRIGQIADETGGKLGAVFRCERRRQTSFAKSGRRRLADDTQSDCGGSIKHKACRPLWCCYRCSNSCIGLLTALSNRTINSRSREIEQRRDRHDERPQVQFGTRDKVRIRQPFQAQIKRCLPETESHQPVFSTLNSLLVFAGAAGFWTLIGLPFARRLLPNALSAFAAPGLGWALHSAVALPLHRLIGFTSLTVWIVSTFAALAAAIVLFRTSPRAPLPMSRLAFAGAALAAMTLSICVAVAIAPKFDQTAVLLSPAMFDHSKVAMIDEMARLGVPPGNPFQGGDSGPLAYYYLWHFSAAELALATGISGWEADAALTAFTALASIMLMMGLAAWFSGRASAAYWVSFLALAGSLRPVLEFLFGKTALYFVIWPPTGFAGWFFQATWVPQHIASATCVVLAILLLTELARKPGLLLLATFVLTVVAAFESSTWVGGITFAFAASVTGLSLLVRMGAPDRRPFILWSIAGAFLALALAAPFLTAQYESSVARGLGSPIALHHYEVLGEFFPGMASANSRPAGLLAGFSAGRVSGDLSGGRHRDDRDLAFEPDDG